MSDFDTLAGTVLSECAAGDLSPNMGLFRLAFAADAAPQVEAALGRAIGAAQGPAQARLTAMRKMWRDSPGAFAAIKDSCRVFNGAMQPQQGIAGFRAAYESIAAFDPAITVALYSLGREDLLAEATAEIAAWFRDRGLLGPDRRALELGCGVGRIVRALAPDLAFMTGIDIAPSMVARARERCADLANVDFQLGDGLGFAQVETAAMDLVVACDSMPDIVDAGEEIARANIAEAARVLKAGGRLVILNFAYRGRDYDLAQVPLLARDFGFTVKVLGERPFYFWDGAVFDLARR